VGFAAPRSGELFLSLEAVLLLRVQSADADGVSPEYGFAWRYATG
jgi:hypothetical protein